MNSILNEPQSDAFEDKFFEELRPFLDEEMKFPTFPKGMYPRYFGIYADAIKHCVGIAHAYCGGECGDEPYDYGMQLVNEYLTQHHEHQQHNKLTL